MKPLFFVGLMIAVIFLAMVHTIFLLPTLGAEQTLVDFDAFYIVGQLGLEGRLAEAYNLPRMAAIQRELVGHDGFMPWTYPPQFDLLTLWMPLLPRGVAYGLFTGLTVSFYLWVLIRLAGERAAYTLLALKPPILVCVFIGQNGFLVGGLMGLYCLLALKNRYSAGWALGVLAIKPHLGVGLGLHALVRGDWRTLLIAVFVALASAAVATLVFGPLVWLAFWQGVQSSGDLLQAAFYPLFRMMSVYALLHTIGVPPQIALWGQIAAVVVALCLIVWASWQRIEPRILLGMTCLLSVLMSPYIYDYDMTIAGIGLALIVADLHARASTVERLLILLLIWVAGGWGMFHAVGLAGLPWEERAAIARTTISYGAFAYLSFLIVAARILRRPPGDPGTAPVSA